MTKIITLSQGKVALVDDDMFDYLSQWRWYMKSNGYACCHLDNKKSAYMHRLVMNAPSGVQVDHISGDGLDNQKSNLRLASCNQNQMNQRKSAANTSGYKGVTWEKGRARWFVSIKLDQRTRFVGRFRDIHEAARAYDKAARSLFGCFARLNFPEEA